MDEPLTCQKVVGDNDRTGEMGSYRGPCGRLGN